MSKRDEQETGVGMRSGITAGSLVQGSAAEKGARSIAGAAARAAGKPSKQPVATVPGQKVNELL